MINSKNDFTMFIRTNKTARGWSEKSKAFREKRQ